VRWFWGVERPDLYEILLRSTDPEEIIPAAIRESCPWAGRVALDIGCGRGDFAASIAEEAGSVVAVDAAPSMVAAARRNMVGRSGRFAAITANVENLPFADGSFDVAYALWAYFFGAGAEPGLFECERVLRRGGRLCVVQNNGGDGLSGLWSESEFRCLEWPEWFEQRGFSRRIVDTVWRFPSLDQGTALVRYLWGEGAVRRLLRSGTLTFSFKVSLYCREVGGGTPDSC